MERTGTREEVGHLWTPLYLQKEWELFESNNWILSTIEPTFETYLFNFERQSLVGLIRDVCFLSKKLQFLAHHQSVSYRKMRDFLQINFLPRHSSVHCLNLSSWRFAVTELWSKNSRNMGEVGHHDTSSSPRSDKWHKLVLFTCRPIFFRRNFWCTSVNLHFGEEILSTNIFSIITL